MPVPRRPEGAGQDNHQHPLQENPGPKPREDQESAPGEPLRAPGQELPSHLSHAAHVWAPVLPRIESSRPSYSKAIL